MNKTLNSIKFSNIVTVRDRLSKIPNALRLDSGDPDFDTAEHIKETAKKALLENKTHYAPSDGVGELKDAILYKLQNSSNKHGLNNIIVTNGGMHGLYCIFRTLLDKGDFVLLPKPNWTPVEQVIRLCGGIPMYYDIDNPNLEYNINKKFIKVIFVNSPHNPTGKIIPYDQLKEIVDFAKEYDTVIVSDEAYEDIIYTDYWVPMSRFSYPNIISCYTLSKSYAMTGWRLGYVVAPSDFITEMKKVVLYSINGVSTPVQYAAIAALKGGINKTMISTYKKRRDILYRGIANCRYLTCELPKGAFYIYAHLTDLWKQSEAEFVSLLMDNGIGCIPGKAFGGDRAIRFAYACNTNQVEEAAERLSKL